MPGRHALIKTVMTGAGKREEAATGNCMTAQVTGKADSGRETVKKLKMSQEYRIIKVPGKINVKEIRTRVTGAGNVEKAETGNSMTTQVARKKDPGMEQKRSQEYHTVKMTEMGRPVIQSTDVRGLVIMIGIGVVVTLNVTMKDRVVISTGINIQHQMEQEKYDRIAVVSPHMIHKA
jgi:hypothetical protein